MSSFSFYCYTQKLIQNAFNCVANDDDDALNKLLFDIRIKGMKLLKEIEMHPFGKDIKTGKNNHWKSHHYRFIFSLVRLVTDFVIYMIS